MAAESRLDLLCPDVGDVLSPGERRNLVEPISRRDAARRREIATGLSLARMGGAARRYSRKRGLYTAEEYNARGTGQPPQKQSPIAVQFRENNTGDRGREY